MSGLSIDDILIKIDERLDDLHLTENNLPSVSLDPLSEVGLYITNDNLLSDLYRQYLESQRNYICSIKTHGKDAPMTEIASDMAESCFCAMETRLIELREEKELARKVQKLQEKQRQNYIMEMKARQEEYARRGIPQPVAINQEDVYSKKKPKDDLKDASWDAFWLMLMLAFLQGKNKFFEKPATVDFAKAAA